MQNTNESEKEKLKSADSRRAWQIVDEIEKCSALLRQFKAEPDQTDMLLLASQIASAANELKRIVIHVDIKPAGK